MQATTSTRKRPLDTEAAVKEETASAAEEATKKPKTEPDKNDKDEDNSSVVSKVVVDLVNTVGGSSSASESNGVKAEGQKGLDAARAFRERSLRRILRQNLNKAVNDDAGVDNVVKSVEELKKKMKVVMLSALVRSKSETEEAGHDLFKALASEDEESESEPEHNNSSLESSKKEVNPEEGVVKNVLEEFIDGSKQSKELLGGGDSGGNARGNLLVELLGSLKNELHKELRQAKKKRRKKMAAAAASASSAASTSIVLTEEETKVIVLLIFATNVFCCPSKVA